MKLSKVFSLLPVIFVLAAATNAAVIIDYSALAWYSAASNDSGQTGVVFVAKDDTAGDTLWPLRFQAYQGSVLIADDTVVKKWDRNTSFGYGRFSLALDRSGWAHLVYAGDSGSCVYASNRGDGKWKTRYKDGHAAGVLGRLNCIDLYGDQLDIVYTFDYRVGGGYPFSNLHRLSTVITSDSIAATFITAKSQAIYAEVICDIAISNQCGRLVVFYGLRQSGGWQADMIIVSKDYPKITDYYYLELRSAWYLSVSPVSIIDDQPKRIIVGFDGIYYPGIDTVYVSDSGLTGIKNPYRLPRGIPARDLRQMGQKVFDPLGRVLPGASIGMSKAAGLYLSKTIDHSHSLKRLQIGR
ncbi:MAG: hypothetical protein PHE24_03430 [Patescibacteria group bacterium]|nr:hypothetical protein [Patescibacteria group bacterium]